jgi:hypothetical protein
MYFHSPLFFGYRYFLGIIALTYDLIFLEIENTDIHDAMDVIV